ncbi:MAG: WD40/YVTN/BNR-like repeat-containing protein [Candidatus Dormibacteraceae bacterium]
MDVREQLHDALDAEDFPSRTLLSRSIAALDTPRATRSYGRLASLTAGVIAVAVIATLVAVRMNSSPSSLPTLPPATTIANLIDYRFISPQVGFVELRSSAIIFATTSDGGRTWHQALALRGQISTPVMQWFDARRGIVVGQQGHSAVVWGTIDGGLHWQSHAVPLPQDTTSFGSGTVAEDSTLETAYFLTPVQGWVVYRYQGDCGGCGFSAERFVYETNDGGLRWTEVSASSLEAAERQLTFFTSSWGVLSSGVAFYELDVTHDGGRTWQPSTIPGFVGRCQVTCEVNARQTHGFFAGDQGLMAISWCLDEAGASAGGACYQTFPFKPTEVHLYRTTDGGLTWAYVRDLPLSTGSISFIDPQQAVNVGPEGVSWTSDAGATWSSPNTSPVPAGWYVQRSEFADAQHGWLAITNSSAQAWVGTVNVTDRFQLLATTDGGSTWHQVGLPKA